MPNLTRSLIAVAVAFVPESLLAHHGAVGHPTLYLAENLIELEGEVAEIFWRNPHPRMRMAAVNEDGETEIWELELPGSPISFSRRGISIDDFVREGDRVRVAGVAAKFGTNMLGVLHYLRPDGREYVNGNRELRWSDEQFDAPVQPLDPARVAEARRTARGIFRVWGNDADGTGAHPPVSEYAPYLTERGRELAAQWDRARDDLELQCRQGMPTTMFDPVPMQIIDDGERILIRVMEYDVERVVHMNTGASDTEPTSSPLGYSVGRWDGETLVVTTTHVGWPQFDPYGTPQSDLTSYVETFALSDDGDNVLNYTFTASDPVMFTQPITLHRPRRWTPGVELERFDCAAEWDDSAG